MGEKKKISPILIVATSIDVDDNKDGFESSKKKNNNNYLCYKNI